MSPMIRVDGLRRMFEDVVALDDLHFEVPKGVICGFVGPNGAGKSTTMRILATLDLPDRGDVFVGGINAVRDPHAVRNLIGFMPDNAGVIEHIRVSEYLEFFSRARGLRGPEGRAEQARIAQFTGLTRLLARPVAGLSKGELQRLSLSRALFGSPSVLILDEPAAGLDPRARVELRELLKLLVRMSSATILISSHILTELQNMVDMVVVVEAGKVRYQGTLAELLSQHERRAVYFVEHLPDQGDAVRRWMTEQPAVLAVEASVDDNQVRIEIDEEREAPESVIARAFADGHVFRQFFAQQADLEGLYMQLVKPTAAAGPSDA